MSRSAGVRCWSVVLALVAVGVPVGTVSGETIMLDEFDRGSSETLQNLQASTPTSYDSAWFTGTPTWGTYTGDTYEHSTDGTVLTTHADSSVTQNAAYLLFEFQTGYVYTLEADVNVGSSEIWTGIGFLGDYGDTPAYGYADGYFWMLQRESNKTKAFTGLGTNGGSAEVATSDTSAHLKIVLDTTLGAASASTPWSVEWYNDEVSNPDNPVHSVSWTTPVDIVGVFLASYGDTTIDNFQLSAEAVPEPSSFALVALAVLGLAVGGARHRWR